MSLFYDLKCYGFCKALLSTPDEFFSKDMNLEAEKLSLFFQEIHSRDNGLFQLMDIYNSHIGECPQTEGTPDLLEWDWRELIKIILNASPNAPLDDLLMETMAATYSYEDIANTFGITSDDGINLLEAQFAATDGSNDPMETLKRMDALRNIWKSYQPQGTAYADLFNDAEKFHSGIFWNFGLGFDADRCWILYI